MEHSGLLVMQTDLIPIAAYGLALALQQRRTSLVVALAPYERKKPAAAVVVAAAVGQPELRYVMQLAAALLVVLPVVVPPVLAPDVAPLDYVPPAAAPFSVDTILPSLLDRK